MSQKEPGGARESQGEPGSARKSQEAGCKTMRFDGLREVRSNLKISLSNLKEV